MSYVILGRAIKNEYLAIGTILSAVGVGVLSSGGKKEAAPPQGSGRAALEKVKETVKLNASSSEEEELMNSIRKFVADAEKEDAKH